MVILYVILYLVLSWSPFFPLVVCVCVCVCVCVRTHHLLALTCSLHERGSEFNTALGNHSWSLMAGTDVQWSDGFLVANRYIHIEFLFLKWISQGNTLSKSRVLISAVIWSLCGALGVIVLLSHCFVFGECLSNCAKNFVSNGTVVIHINSALI